MNIIAVPIELRRNFLANAGEFIRNLACWPTSSINPFFRQTSPLSLVIDHSRQNLWDFQRRQLMPELRCAKGDTRFRYMHFDLSENNDRVGFSMCHVPFHIDRTIYRGETPLSIRVPFIYYDFVGGIEVSKSEELDFRTIPDYVMELRDRGYYIDLITFDRFQSTTVAQILNGEGFHCGRLSVDRTSFSLKVEKRLKSSGELKEWKLRRISTDGEVADAMNALKSAIYEERCNVPAWDEWIRLHPQDPRHPFIAEAFGAEMTVDGTVDHGPFSTIDILQGMAGAAYNAQNNAPDLGDDVSQKNVSPKRQDNVFDTYHRSNREVVTEVLRSVNSLQDHQRAMSYLRGLDPGRPVDTWDLEFGSFTDSFDEF